MSDIETIVLQSAWEGKTYDEMSILYGYSAEYLNKDVGNKLWHKLTEVLGEKVSKKNFKEALKRAWEKEKNTSLSITHLPFPEGAVAINSPFYIERYEIDSLCFETVIKAGSLIRVKAPELMGKTSLMNRILNYAEQQNYKTVYLDLKSVDKQILTHLDKFLRWLCCMVSRQLKLENRLNDYWDTEILGSNDNCTVYFEEYLL
ncbi:MAG: AAA-like domain-containing protein, partial [Scytonema sp. PMC 1069.18]|nr:AAA-like domain-containing protein [Scytonema sp. PMC 1069.18]